MFVIYEFKCYEIVELVEKYRLFVVRCIDISFCKTYCYQAWLIYQICMYDMRNENTMPKVCY